MQPETPCRHTTHLPCIIGMLQVMVLGASQNWLVQMQVNQQSDSYLARGRTDRSTDRHSWSMWNDSTDYIRQSKNYTYKFMCLISYLWRAGLFGQRGKPTGKCEAGKQELQRLSSACHS